MVDGFATLDVEGVMALASSNRVEEEVEPLVGKAVLDGLTATAMQRVLQDIGAFAGAHDEESEAVMNQEAPLTPDGDVCESSWDGVNVPQREPGVKTGRFPERLGIGETRVRPTTWKEAAVGGIAICATGSGEEDEPVRLDKRYFARMPEPGMARLLTEQEAAVRDLFERRRGPFRPIAVICDGKRPI